MTTAAVSDAWLYGIVNKYPVPRLYRDDAVQEMRLALWRAKPGMLPSVVAGRALISFLRVLLHDEPRRLNRPIIKVVDFDAEIQDLIMERLTGKPSTRDTWLDVESALAQLDERSRTILLEHAYRDTPLAEIALRHGVCVARVGQILRRARRRMREECA